MCLLGQVHHFFCSLLLFLRDSDVLCCSGVGRIRLESHLLCVRTTPCKTLGAESNYWQSTKFILFFSSHIFSTLFTLTSLPGLISPRHSTSQSGRRPIVVWWSLSSLDGKRKVIEKKSIISHRTQKSRRETSTPVRVEIGNIFPFIRQPGTNSIVESSSSSIFRRISILDRSFYVVVACLVVAFFMWKSLEPRRDVAAHKKICFVTP